MNVRFIAEAAEDLDGACAWYDRNRPGLGDDLMEAFERAIEAVRLMPRLWPKEPSIRRAEIRFRTVDRFPYRIIYELTDDEIIVLAVAHLSQRPGYWKRRRG